MNEQSSQSHAIVTLHMDSWASWEQGGHSRCPGRARELFGLWRKHVKLTLRAQGLRQGLPILFPVLVLFLGRQ
jgi:hypothetical protein